MKRVAMLLLGATKVGCEVGSVVVIVSVMTVEIESIKKGYSLESRFFI
jgi:hypothetical protein